MMGFGQAEMQELVLVTGGLVAQPFKTRRLDTNSRALALEWS